ncbi:aspartate ammonia-lyase [Granulicatella balaenopterae]|uniref:aspartate ammonia-lyase n=1 Tax=Granulicatella balaenopterae TaxID=137733 RepID=A0A1H9LFV7_9LACT|nr:aspartate ammonia-lyase [Granulicatella balaenopterae]
MLNRIEADSIGEKNIDQQAYYGVQTLRAFENFKISGRTINDQMINALAYVKKASAMTNAKVGLLDNKKMKAITEACDEILSGELHEWFIVDPIQGGAGTSMNMNANEVIANRGLELLGHEKGQYQYLHPNDHVNYGQSTNDVIPTAGKIATIFLIDDLIVELKAIQQTLELKAIEFKDILKMGRTQMQDAVPIRLGQEFAAYASAVERDIKRLEYIRQELMVVNLGGTAIGTGINADEEYVKEVVPILAELTELPLVQAVDLVDATQNLDIFTMASAIVKSSAISLSKVANDLRLMSSGPKTGFGEITLPAKQNGSSIMPGKVNPVIPEVVNQVAFNIMGNDTTISLAVESGQLELNAFEPIIFYKLFESISTLTNAINTFNHNCIVGILANQTRCQQLVEHSVGIITALCPHIGYQKAADIAKEAIYTGATVKSLIKRENLLSTESIDIILNPETMTRPGISGKQLLTK